MKQLQVSLRLGLTVPIDKAYQRKIRESSNAPDFKLSLENAEVREIQKVLAKKTILEYEWLGTLPPAQKYYGLFCDNILVAVSVFSLTCGVSPSASKMFGLKIDEVAYLMRGACVKFAPRNSASYLISRAVSSLPDKIKAVIAYSDLNAGEVGTIYQSLNWYCLGFGSQLQNIVFPDGTSRDQMYVYDMAKKNNITCSQMRSWFLENGYSFEKKTPKIRYVYLRDKALFEKIKPKVKKYVKRGEFYK